MSGNFILKYMANKRWRDCIWLFALNIVLLLFLFCFSGENISCDGYGILVKGFDYHIETFIGSYRFFGALVYYLLSLTNHIPFYNSFVDVLFFVLLSAIIITGLVYAFIEQLKLDSILTTIILDVSVLISVINVWFCNILSFPECIILSAVGLFCCFLSIIIIIKWNNWYAALLSSLLLMLATAVYQQFMFMFIMYILSFFSMKIMTMPTVDNKNIFCLAKKRAFVILFGGMLYITCAFGIASIFKIKGSERLAFSIESIIEKILFYVEKQKLYLSGRGFYDTKIMLYCFMIMFIVILGSVIIFAIKNRKYIRTLISLLLSGLSYFVAYLPGIITEGDGVRQLFPLYSMFFVTTVIVLSVFNSRKILCIYLAFLIGVFSVNSIQIMESEANLKEINALDSYWGDLVLYEIEEYEKESGIKIDSIAFCEDDMPIGNTIKSSYTESVLTVDWARGYFLRYKAHDRLFQEIDMPDDIYMMYFAEKNWDNFNRKEQIKFIDNTAYICCY